MPPFAQELSARSCLRTVSFPTGSSISCQPRPILPPHDDSMEFLPRENTTQFTSACCLGITDNTLDSFRREVVSNCNSDNLIIAITALAIPLYYLLTTRYTNHNTSV
ncbi:hypothetical protein QCA50_003628 [Cerrena zonata]|uniref:Uncharacterized protein n=1 Tax=Cerrena zonata TaxID=2478898 RepID=A0AAW0GQ78_9APHY